MTAIRRFTVAAERVQGGRVVFDADESRHLTRVVRLRPGDTVVATDGAGHEYTVRLETVGPEATGTVVGDAAPAAPALSLALVQGIPKGDRMEAIVRASTELGVERVLPAITERTVVRLEPARWRERARRWQRVAREAAKQSRRATIPAIEPPRPFGECLGADLGVDLRLCLWEGDAAPLDAVLAAVPVPGSIAVLVGPEGGLARAEVEAAAGAGWRVVSLGPRIVRTETAGPAVLAILQHRFGDLGRPCPS